MHAGSQAFLCCCICHFPLPQLTAAELPHHPTNTDLFQHFHLPLSALQAIKTKDQKVQWEMHLFRLHKAHVLLLDQEAELAAFEQQIDASKLSLQQQADAEIADAKAKVRALRQAFSTALKAAIKETSDHALERWTPASGSLSALIYNFDLSNPASMKVFTLEQEMECPKPLLRIGIQSVLPAFSRFAQTPAARGGTRNQLEEARQQCQQLQADVGKLRQEVVEVRGENARLKEQIANLQRRQQPSAIPPSQPWSASSTSVLSPSSQPWLASATSVPSPSSQPWSASSSSLPSRQPPPAIPSSQPWPTASVPSRQPPKPAAAPVSQTKSSQSLPAASPLNQGKTEHVVTQPKPAPTVQSKVGQVASAQSNQSAAMPPSQGQSDHFSRGLALKEQGKYAESHAALSAAWEIAKKAAPVTERAAEIAIALAEVAGLHMGKIADAESCLELIRTNLRACRQSTEMAELANVSAALDYSCGQFSRCAELCTRTLRNYPAAKAKGAVFWTALFYCVMAHCELSNSALAETELNKYAVGYADALSRMAGMIVGGRLAFAKSNFKEAERQLQGALQISTERFPTSVFHAYAQLWLGRTYLLRKPGNIDIKTLQEAEKCFVAHYPANIWRAQGLSCEAKALKAAGTMEDAVAKANQALHLYQTHHPEAAEKIAVLQFLASGYRDLGLRDVAIEKRKEAQEMYTKQGTRSVAVQQNLMNLAILYQEIGKHQAAAKMRIDIHRELQASYPTNILLPQNLIALASLYQQMGMRVKAIEKRVEANEVLKAHNINDVSYPQNIVDLAGLYQEEGQLELALTTRVTVSQIFATRFFAHGSVVSNLEMLAELCLNLGRLQDAENYALQARAAVSTPSSSAAQNLYTLSLTYERMGRLAEATDTALTALQMWQGLNSPNAQSLAAPLLQRLQTVKKRGRPMDPPGF